MTLLQKTKDLLTKYNLSPDVLHDQHLCVEESVFKTLLQEAHLQKTDIVAEVGAGEGLLTAAIASRVSKVTAIELDIRFLPILEKLPSNVNVVIGNALDILPVHKEHTKIISNLPYQICEPFLHYLCTATHVKRAVITVPKSFAQKSQHHPIFSSFFDIAIVKEVPKTSFYPPPRVTSAIIRITPRKEHDSSSFLIRKLYLQRDKKLRNGLRDALVDLKRDSLTPLTKKSAMKIIEQARLPASVLNKTISSLPSEVYQVVVKNTLKDRNIH